MIVSWEWLKQYVALDVPVEEFERRLMMAGLNHEGTERVGDDLAIDLEVTSNRPDCLGHIGIAREAAVLFEQPLKLPAAQPTAKGPKASTLTRVRVECPELCPAYSARVIRGVKIGPSPEWLARRLATIGIPAINNVVDVTNYVLMECGQPLHAFDFAKLEGREIIVRTARAGEKLVAIDHKTYELSPQMCVIADARRPVALAGVMGGSETEVSAHTAELLIEAARFDPASIRATARKLGLHSASSYRFERGVDPEGVDWASRRACELILDLAGGELAEGAVVVEQPRPAAAPITLRLSTIERILGISIPMERVRAILTALGAAEQNATTDRVTVTPPSWRSDVEREIDLVEEVARIHGYDAIPEDARAPMAPSSRSAADVTLSRVRNVLAAAGYDEAVTLSVVEEDWSSAFSPWTDHPPLVTQTPVLRRADRLRRSLAPSLLGVRRTNESLGATTIEVFEIAKVYLPKPAGLPEEPWMIGLTSGEDFFAVKGVVEALIAGVKARAPLEAVEAKLPLLDRSCELRLGGERFGFLGEVSSEGRKQFDLRGPATVAELRFDLLLKHAVLAPQYVKQPAFPAITRDLNFTLDERVRWAELEATVRESGGPHLEEVAYRDTYRDPERVGAGKKRTLLSIRLRSAEGTLTNQEADALRDKIAAACRERLGAELVAG